MDKEKYKTAFQLDQLIIGTQSNIKTLKEYEAGPSFTFATLKAQLRNIDNGFTLEELEKEYTEHIQSFLDSMAEKCRKVKTDYETQFELV